MIEKYVFGKIFIDRHSYTSDLIIVDDQVFEKWWRKKGHELCVADIELFVDQYKPTRLIVGTGKFGRMKILPETISYLNSLELELDAHKTQQAFLIYNHFSMQGKG